MARSGRTLNCDGGWNRGWRSWSRSGGALARLGAFELGRASSQRDSPASINTPLTLSSRGWRDGCGWGRREVEGLVEIRQAVSEKSFGVWVHVKSIWCRERARRSEGGVMGLKKQVLKLR